MSFLPLYPSLRRKVRDNPCFTCVYSMARETIFLIRKILLSGIFRMHTFWLYHARFSELVNERKPSSPDFAGCGVATVARRVWGVIMQA